MSLRGECKAWRGLFEWCTDVGSTDVRVVKIILTVIEYVTRSARLAAPLLLRTVHVLTTVCTLYLCR